MSASAETPFLRARAAVRDNRRMAKKKTTSTGGAVPTNYGYGTLADGTKITFLASDATHAVIQTPDSLKGRSITRPSTSTTVWSLV